MNCRQFHKRYVELVDLGADAEAPGRGELLAHLHSCAECTEFYNEIRRVLVALRPRHTVAASPPFKERVMSRIVEIEQTGLPTIAAPGTVRTRRWRFVLVAASLVLVVGMASLVHWVTRDRNARPTESAYYLFTKACAAEEAFFPKSGIVHLVNEIFVKAVSNPDLARMRWLPMASMQEEGRLRIDQLTLPADPGEQYVVEDQAWYDPATGRFVRLLTTGGKPIFGNSYDGQAVHSLNVGANGAVQVSGKPIGKDFRPPASPAEFLGIAAGLRSSLSGNEGGVQDAGTSTLADGSAVRVLKATFSPGPNEKESSYWLFRIRQDDSTIAEKEWFIGGKSMLLVRRAKTETVDGSEISWNLARFNTVPAETQERPKAAVTPDMVIPNVSVRHMVEKADFETCIFAANPSWASQRQITDILDVASPPHRMFSITYRAKDGRHVVLVQSPTYNAALGAKTKLPEAKPVYQSPKGFKAWSGPADRMAWMADILLQSAGYAKPSEQRTSYLLETPAGTFPALAINGQVTDEELHALIDSLVPAREYQGE